VRPANETPSYPISETLRSAKGMKFITAVYPAVASMMTSTSPMSDFEKDIVAAGGKGGGVVKDDHTWANIIRTQGVPTPPPPTSATSREFRRILDRDGRPGAIPDRGRAG